MVVLARCVVAVVVALAAADLARGMERGTTALPSGARHVARKAQAELAPPPPGATTSRRDPNNPETGRGQQQNSNQGSTVIPVESAHNYVFDAAILVVLVGGALFLVCRSAGRV